MAVTNRDRVKSVLDELNSPLREWAAPRLERAFGRPWLQAAVAQTPLPAGGSGTETWVLLWGLVRGWPEAVGDDLTSEDRRCAEGLTDAGLELVASGSAVSSDRCERALFDGERLAKAIGAVDVSAALGDARAEYRRVRFQEDQERQKKQAARELDVKFAPGALPAWRDVVTPHDDVASGEFQLADFAADLRLVHEGKARVEYSDPGEFFARTYMTEGLTDLLTQTALRMHGRSGDPLLDLMTTFGGGKTHSMLAVYHAVSGHPVEQMDGMGDICVAAGVDGIPAGVRRALVVGDNFSIHGSVKPDGTHVKTLMGEIAWQLGEHQAYDRIAMYDRASDMVPASEIEDLLNAFSPCVILIDEWVIYLRQLVGLPDDAGKPAGTFGSNMSAVQALTSALRAAPRAMLIASLPASDSVLDLGHGEHIDNAEELGGTAGVEALRSLRSVIHRVERPWRPATLEESFEIVRRRLFKPFDAKQEAQRSIVVEAFRRYYLQNQREVPSEASQAEYASLLRHAYPVHPELFSRLFEDWSTLERFQRTRGVLRLMATVVHALWTRGDTGPVILPASIPLDDSRVIEEFARVLDDKWQAVISTDLAGSTSTAAQIDKTIQLYGRTGATQRVARCIFLGSVPFANRRETSGHVAVNRGIERKRVMLGATYPGDNIGNATGALQKLASDATYVNREDERYSLGLSRTLAQLVREKADGFHDTDIADGLVAILRAEKDTGEFARVSRCPGTSADVDDDPTLALVIFGPDRPYRKTGAGKAVSKAEEAALEFLKMRGTQARVNRNTLLFVAPDQGQLDTLIKLVRSVKAWQSVIDESDRLNLTPAMKRDAEARLKQDTTARNDSVRLTYKWFLYPEQDPGAKDITVNGIPMNSDGGIATRASKKATTSDFIYPLMSVSTLRMWIDKLKLWESQPHVPLEQLSNYFARHIYLPTLVKPDVFYRTVRERPDATLVLNDGFAYATAFENDRYLGLTLDQVAHAASTGLIVDPTVARSQMDAEASATKVDVNWQNPNVEVESQGGNQRPTTGLATGSKAAAGVGGTAVAVALSHLYAEIDVPLDRPVKMVSDLAQEVLKHLTAQGVSVSLRLDLTVDGLERLGATLRADVVNNLKTIGFHVDE